VEVITSVQCRRRWRAEERRAMVEEAEQTFRLIFEDATKLKEKKSSDKNPDACERNNEDQ
jgi:hypothetical protein